MRIDKKNIKTDFTSCNFCNQVKILKYSRTLIPIYGNVISFKSDGNGICASICEECLDEELYDKGKKIFNQ